VGKANWRKWLPAPYSDISLDIVGPITFFPLFGCGLRPQKPSGQKKKKKAPLVSSPFSLDAYRNTHGEVIVGSILPLSPADWFTTMRPLKERPTNLSVSFRPSGMFMGEDYASRGLLLLFLETKNSWFYLATVKQHDQPTALFLANGGERRFLLGKRG